MWILWISSFFILILIQKKILTSIEFFSQDWLCQILNRFFGKGRGAVLFWCLRSALVSAVASLLSVFVFQVNEQYIFLIWTCLALFMGFGSFFLSASTIESSRMYQIVKLMLQNFFALGLWLLFFQIWIKQSSFLQEGFADLALWLADGRMVNLLGLAVFAALISQILKGTFWSWPFGLYLVLTGSSPVSVPLTIVLVDMVINLRDQKIKRKFEVVLSMTQFLVGFLFIGYFRDFWPDPNNFIEGTWGLLVLLYIQNLIWGHFVFKNPVRFQFQSGVARQKSELLHFQTKTFVERVISFVIQ